LGFPELGMAMHSIDLYGGVALFTVYNAYDTHVVIRDYETGNRDYVGHATNYSLNCINIFIRLLEIFARAKKD
jgi:FtsH-binding integral membrane protein